ncbi:winged helix-turn-helix domain-containing protein [Pelosinus fermentans]|uniref:winged helix-turn-helix domain-containing protein n=1 Tax=Pelosinus fermentans TaxID=365349 RepID=UPI0003018C40
MPEYTQFYAEPENWLCRAMFYRCRPYRWNRERSELLRHPHTIFTRENLLVNLWGYDFDGDERTVDTTIKRIRRKLGIAGDFIKTVRGSGYKFGVDQS